MEEELKVAKFHCIHTVDIDNFKNRVFLLLEHPDRSTKKQPSSRKKWITSIVLSIVIIPSTIGFAYTELSQKFKWNNIIANIQNTKTTDNPTVTSKTSASTMYKSFNAGKEDIVLTNGSRVPRKIVNLAETRKVAKFPVHDANQIGKWKRIDGYGIYSAVSDKKSDGTEVAYNTDFLAAYASIFMYKSEAIHVDQTFDNNPSKGTTYAYFGGPGVRKVSGFGDDLAVLLPGSINRLEIWSKQNNQINIFNFESNASDSSTIEFAHEFLNAPTK